MQKLINAFKANPSYDNAVKVWKYERSHPMAICMVSAEDAAIVDKCIQIAINAPQA